LDILVILVGRFSFSYANMHGMQSKSGFSIA